MPDSLPWVCWCEAVRVNSKLQWKPQDDRRFKKAEVTKWSLPKRGTMCAANGRDRESRLSNLSGAQMMSLCILETRHGLSCRVPCVPCWISILLWSSLGFLSSSHSLLSKWGCLLQVIPYWKYIIWWLMLPWPKAENMPWDEKRFEFGLLSSVRRV